MAIKGRYPVRGYITIKYNIIEEINTL